MKEELRVQAAVDLNAIRHNYRALRAQYGKVKLMSVLKADAYGHGIAGIAKVCDALTDWFAVATVEEGIRLRSSGAQKPILLLGPVTQGQILQAAKYGLTFSVGSVSYAELLQSVLHEAGCRAACHLKLDTGMNRTGIRYRQENKPQALEQIRRIYAMDALHVTGTYTHLPCSDSQAEDDRAFTRRQLLLFDEVVCAMRENSLKPGLLHCYSTGGSLVAEGTLYDMVRTGMMVYGQCDTLEHQKKLGLCEAMRWTSRVVEIETLKAGEYVSYGRTFQAKQDMRIGIVSCGYADGFRRSYQTVTQVLAGGVRTEILGRICMDFFVLNLSNVPQAHVGMEVTMLGEQNGERISAIELAGRAQSTCGEVTAAISARVPRIYTDGETETEGTCNGCTETIR